MNMNLTSQVELEFTDFYLCRWEWFLCPKDLHGNSPTLASSHDPTDLQRVSTARVYWPSDRDASCKLLIRCTPFSADGREGEPVTKLSAAIRESPKVTPITRRHLLTPARLARPQAFRVVTYNTLAGVFTVDDYSHNVLYPYCDPAALDIQYRQGRIVHELIGYNADVLCLQEVGTSTFHKFFLPAMRDKGYEGCHETKAGNKVSFSFAALTLSKGKISVQEVDLFINIELKKFFFKGGTQFSLFHINFYSLEFGLLVVSD